MVFARGKLVGGIDILRELADEGQLVEQLSRGDGEEEEEQQQQEQAAAAAAAEAAAGVKASESGTGAAENGDGAARSEKTVGNGGNAAQQGEADAQVADAQVVDAERGDAVHEGQPRHAAVRLFAEDDGAAARAGGAQEAVAVADVPAAVRGGQAHWRAGHCEGAGGERRAGGRVDSLERRAVLFAFLRSCSPRESA
ncbi:hypothetical protein FGB62_252g011 [Gracilaria domingensis]|nr:hypothetical protein FGB62_252g011 [Gracilaria domingensis]